MSTGVGVKRVYDFAEGSRDMRDLLGGKGANVAEMTRLGLPVPKGFTITTETCIAYLKGGHAFPEGLDDEVSEHLAALEAAVGTTLGDAENPLLVSVRSGAKFSMPGMMDTVLNLGLNDRSVEGLAQRTGNPRFARDSYRRFIQMFGDVVSEVPKHLFEDALDALKTERGVEQDVDLTAEDLRGSSRRTRGSTATRRARTSPRSRAPSSTPPSAPCSSRGTTSAAHDYRRLNRIPYELGTAVNVQQMVFGNTGPTSGTGVAFTRNNVTGEKGEPVRRLPHQRAGRGRGGRHPHPAPAGGAEGRAAEAFAQLIETMDLLEQTYRNMQDVEFTIEDGALYMLQTRNGKRSAQAMARIAVDLVAEGVVTEDESLVQLVNAGPGTPAAPAPARPAEGPRAARDRRGGVARRGHRDDRVHRRRGGAAGHGRRAGDPGARRDHARRLPRDGRGAGDPDRPRRQDQPRRDRRGRAWGRRAVCGVTAIRFLDDGTITIAGETFREGDRITIDGTSGSVFPGDAPLLPPDPDNPYLVTILGWADRVRRLKVRTNADTPDDAARARRVRGRGDRPVPHGAHVPGRGPPADRAVDDHGGGRRGAGRVPRTSCGCSSSPTSRASSARWPGCRSRSGCSTRRCTSSCPTWWSCRRGWRSRRPPAPRPGGRGAPAPGAGAARGQPDARHPRVPPGDRVAGRLPDAGRGDHERRLRGEGRRRRRAAGRRS